MNAKPNILFILTDQHAPKVSGFAGDPVVRTPHLDALASRSVQFETASCASPACTPSRMCLLTAMEPHRCAAWANHWIIFPEQVTWPGHFAEHGYATCLVGKMHFGGKDQLHGFQYRPYGDFHHGLSHQPEPLSFFPRYHNAESARVTEIPESLIQDVIVTREAQAFLLEHQDRKPEQPWFLCAGYGRPHAPFTAPGRYIRRYRDRTPPLEQPADCADRLEPYARHMYDRLSSHLTEEQIRRGREGYYACVDFVDDCIGELLDTLRQNGMLENTVVIYTSDHGEMGGAHGLWQKGVYYEEAMGVPLLITGPGIQPGHARLSDVVSLMDLFPTCCSLTGLPIPAGLDGMDFSPLLRDPARGRSPREFAPSQYFEWGTRIKIHALPIGQATRAWRAIRTRDWKYVEVQGGKPLLFDMINDPREMTNLAERPEQAERCGELRQRLFQRFDWEEAMAQLRADLDRVPAFVSGVKPTTPNQYQFPDGRVFDAEASLYQARWLNVEDDATGGIIPQQFG